MSIFEPLRSNSYLIIGLLLLGSCRLQANEPLGWEDSFQLHGFLTLGYVKTSANSFFGDSESGSLEYSELGLNASYRFNPQLLVSAQLLSRTAGEMYDGSPSLDYGLLDYTPYTTETGRFGTILGRFKNPMGFYNETRDVASTRPSIFLPQVVYWDRVRNMVFANDGGMLYANMYRGLHSFYLNLFAGKTPIDENVEKSYLPAQLDPDLTQQGLTKGGRLLYEWDGGRLRLALSGATLSLDGEMAGGLLNGMVDIDFWIASAQYNQGPFSLTMEYMNEPIEYNGFNNLMDFGNTTVDGYYLQGDYRLSPDWEVLMRYEEGHFDKHDRNGSDVMVPGTPSFNHYTRGLTVGLLWEPTENLLMRAEYSRIDGTMFLSNLENPDPMATQRSWNMFAFLISYSF